MFLHYAILAGLGLASLPIIIHLLNRRKARVIDWGAMRFLEVSLATRGRRILIEEIILLLLRTALLAVLVLAMARPLLVNPYFTGGANQDVVIVLDGSMSTGLTISGVRGEGRDGKMPPSYFARGQQAALRAIGSLRPGDSAGVVLAAGSARRLTETLVHDMDAAREAVQHAQPTEGSADVVGSLAMAGRMLEAGTNPNKQIIVVSDGRSFGWRADSADDWQSLAGRLAGMSHAPRVQVLELARGLEQPGAAEPLVNLAIESVRMSRPVVGTDLPVVFTVTVRNTGHVPTAAGVRLTLRRAEGAEPAHSETLPLLGAGSRDSVQIATKFDTPGSYRLALEIEYNDALLADNQLVYGIEVLKSLPVLVINGKPSSKPEEDETFRLVQAFQPRIMPATPAVAVGDGGSAVEFLVSPTVIDWENLGRQDMDRYEAVILANVPRLSSEFTAQLQRYVEQGGGLLVAPGDQADRDFYNRELFDDGRGLLPASLGEPEELKVQALAATASAPDDATKSPLPTVRPALQSHPALIGAAEPSLWDSMWIFRRYPLAASGGDVSALLQLDQKGVRDAYALDKAFGRGHVVLLAGPLDMDWGTLPAHQGYVILANELVHYLSSARRSQLNVRRGQTLAAVAPPGEPNVGATLRTPDGQSVNLTRVLNGDRWEFRYGQTGEPGVYEVRLGGLTVKQDPLRPPASQADEMRLYFTVQRDGAESETGLLSDGDRTRISQSLAGVQFHADVNSLLASLKVSDPGKEIWKLLALLVLAMLVAEVLLAGRITRARQGRLDRGIEFGGATQRQVR